MDLTGAIISIGVVALLIIAWRAKPHTGDEENLCTNCGYDLRASQSRCPECGMPFRNGNEHIPLRDDWPADAITPRIVKPDETPVCIYMTDSQWEATALREQLDVRGISAQIADRPVIAQVASEQFLTRSMGSWRVMVWSGDEELATAIRNKLIPPKTARMLEDDPVADLTDRSPAGS